MTRRLVLAWTCLLVAATSAQAQSTFSTDLIPRPTALAKVGLKRHWYGVVPLHQAERISNVSLGGGLVFLQTNEANLHVMNAESGRLLWSANLGRTSPLSLEASSNSFGVYVTNSNMLHAFSKQTGQRLWEVLLDSSASSPTAADEDRVYVGLLNGEMAVYNAKDGRRAWSVQTSGAIQSRPMPAIRVVAYASADGKLHISRSDFMQPLIRWSAVGPIIAPLANYGARTLLVPSVDKSIYSVDLFSGDTNWNFPTGAPIELEPLIADEDVYVVNKEGSLSALDIKSGKPRWTSSTLGGPLLAVTGKKVYLESRDGDMFVVDRQTGSMIYDTKAIRQRAGLNFREYDFGPTNRVNDRLYLVTKSGLIVCLRELDQVQPRLTRDPKSKPIGYIPPEGYTDAPPLPPPASAEEPGLNENPNEPKGAVPAPEPAPEPGAEPAAEPN